MSVLTLSIFWPCYFRKGQTQIMKKCYKIIIFLSDWGQNWKVNVFCHILAKKTCFHLQQLFSRTHIMKKCYKIIIFFGLSSNLVSECNLPYLSQCRWFWKSTINNLAKINCFRHQKSFSRTQIMKKCYKIIVFFVGLSPNLVSECILPI